MNRRQAVQILKDCDIVFLAHTCNNNSIERIQMVAGVFLDATILKKATELYRDHAYIDGNMISFDRSKITYRINEIADAQKERNKNIIYINGRNYASAIYYIKQQESPKQRDNIQIGDNYES